MTVIRAWRAVTEEGNRKEQEVMKTTGTQGDQFQNKTLNNNRVRAGNHSEGPNMTSSSHF